MLPRVVVTGMGVVSPNGTGKEDFCRAVLAGKSGVKRISRFDSSHLPVHIAGEIPEFDELAWVDARERKHVSRVVPLCLAATTEAVKAQRDDARTMVALASVYPRQFVKFRNFAGNVYRQVRRIEA